MQIKSRISRGEPCWSARGPAPGHATSGPDHREKQQLQPRFRCRPIVLVTGVAAPDIEVSWLHVPAGGAHSQKLIPWSRLRAATIPWLFFQQVLLHLESCFFHLTSAACPWCVPCLPCGHRLRFALAQECRTNAYKGKRSTSLESKTNYPPDRRYLSFSTENSFSSSNIRE